MTDYRLYCMDGAKKISAAEWLQADSDEAAVVAAGALKKSVPCELWDRDRLVAIIPPFARSGEAS